MLLMSVGNVLPAVEAEHLLLRIHKSCNLAALWSSCRTQRLRWTIWIRFCRTWWSEAKMRS